MPSSAPSGPLSLSPTSAEMPKSTTFTPVGVSMTLPGVTSRCTTPRACAAASAEATSAPMVIASRHGSCPSRPSRPLSGPPSTSSMTTYGTVRPTWTDSP